MIGRIGWGLVVALATLGAAELETRFPDRAMNGEIREAATRDDSLYRFDAGGEVSLPGLDAGVDGEQVVFGPTTLVPRGETPDGPFALKTTVHATCQEEGTLTAPTTWRATRGTLEGRAGPVVVRHAPVSMGIASTWRLDDIDADCLPRLTVTFSGLSAVERDAPWFRDEKGRTRLVMNRAWGIDSHGRRISVTLRRRRDGIQLVPDPGRFSGPITLGFVVGPMIGFPRQPGYDGQVSANARYGVIRSGDAVWAGDDRAVRRLDAEVPPISLGEDGQLVDFAGGPKGLLVLAEHQHSDLLLSRHDLRTGERLGERIPFLPGQRIETARLVPDTPTGLQAIVLRDTSSSRSNRLELVSLAAEDPPPPLHLALADANQILTHRHGDHLTVAWRETRWTPSGHGGASGSHSAFVVLRLDLVRRQVTVPPLTVGVFDGDALRDQTLTLVSNTDGAWVGAAGKVWFVDATGTATALKLPPATDAKERRPAILRWVLEAPEGPALLTWHVKDRTLRLETLSSAGLGSSRPVGNDAPVLVFGDGGWLERQVREVSLALLGPDGAIARQPTPRAPAPTARGVLVPTPTHLWLSVDLGRDGKKAYSLGAALTETEDAGHRIEHLVRLTGTDRHALVLPDDPTLPIGERHSSPAGGDPAPGGVRNPVAWSAADPWSVWTNQNVTTYGLGPGAFPARTTPVPDVKTTVALGKIPALDAPTEWPARLAFELEASLGRAWLGQTKDHGVVIWETVRPMTPAEVEAHLASLPSHRQGIARQGRLQKHALFFRRVDLKHQRWVDHKAVPMGETPGQLGVDCDARGCTVVAQGRGVLMSRQLPRSGRARAGALETIAHLPSSFPGGLPPVVRSTPTGTVVCWSAQGVWGLRCDRLNGKARFPGETPFGVGWPVAREGKVENIHLDAEGTFWFQLSTADGSALVPFRVP